MAADMKSEVRSRLKLLDKKKPRISISSGITLVVVVAVYEGPIILVDAHLKVTRQRMRQLRATYFREFDHLDPKDQMLLYKYDPRDSRGFYRFSKKALGEILHVYRVAAQEKILGRIIEIFQPDAMGQEQIVFPPLNAPDADHLT